MCSHIFLFCGKKIRALIGDQNCPDIGRSGGENSTAVQPGAGGGRGADFSGTAVLNCPVH